MRLLTIVIAAGLVLGGCRSEISPETLESEKQQAAQKVAVETQRREQAEAQLRVEEARVSRWRFGAALAISVAGFALIFGTILGSSARKDAER